MTTKCASTAEAAGVWCIWFILKNHRSCSKQQSKLLIVITHLKHRHIHKYTCMHKHTLRRGIKYWNLKDLLNKINENIDQVSWWHQASAQRQNLTVGSNKTRPKNKLIQKAWILLKVLLYSWVPFLVEQNSTSSVFFFFERYNSTSSWFLFLARLKI